MNNIFIPYSRQSIARDDIESVKSVLETDFITQGPKVGEFEKKLAGYCGAKYAVVISSGTAALHLACLAAGIKKGDEVITTPISFVATSNSVLFCGGKPVFSDIEPDTVNIDPGKIEKKINSRTKAIMPVHFGGHPCDLEKIQKIALKHNLAVIEDACHALGAMYKNTKIGASRFSDMTVFSFHPVKHITTGEGGAVLTNRKDLFEKLLMLRNHGITRKKRQLLNKKEGRWYYEMHFLGFNYRITDIQAALGISQLKKLDGFVNKRRKLAGIYTKELSKIKGIGLPLERPYGKSSWHIYTIRVDNRKTIFDKLFKAGIGVNVHYRPIYLNPFYKSLGYRKGECPFAEEYYKRALTIPLYPTIKNKEIKFIVKNLKEALN